jgi:hypothetical protein
MFHSANFTGLTILSCGTLRQELNYLNKNAFLNSDKILYTAPGLHENPLELEKQLKRQLNEAKRISQKTIVLYGDRCYVDTKDPSRGIDRIIQETGAHAKRIKAKNCIDMLASKEERQKISKGQKVYWLTPGWLQYWKVIFKDWDQGKANETFPQHDKAILLDPVGIFEEYSTNSPEKILEFSDWMRLNIEPYKISLDRLRRLLLDGIS